MAAPICGSALRHSCARAPALRPDCGSRRTTPAGCGASIVPAVTASCRRALAAPWGAGSAWPRGTLSPRLARSARAAQPLEPARKDPCRPRPGSRRLRWQEPPGLSGEAANSTRAREPRRPDRSGHHRYEKWQSQGVTRADCSITSVLLPIEHTRQNWGGAATPSRSPG